MKGNDLRLGNWIMGIGYMRVTELKTELGNNFITASNKDVVFMDEEDSFQPIELTEKLLYKIGFCFGGASEYGKHYVKTNGNDTLWCKIYESGDMSLTCNNNANLIQLHKAKFLHQLQNAYYLLTNEELEVEL